MHSGDESVRIGLLDIEEPLARQLECCLLDELAQRYAAEPDLGFSPAPASEFRPPHGAFLVAWVGETPSGCGAMKRPPV
jgi:hypothetical protein